MPSFDKEAREKNNDKQSLLGSDPQFDGQLRRSSVSPQFIQCDVPPRLDIPEEGELLGAQDPPELVDHVLGLGMVGRYAVPNQAEGEGQAVQEGDLSVCPVALE